jgi:hypothetical protein
LNTTHVRRFIQFLGKVLFKIQIGFHIKKWARGFGKEDKDMEERKIYICVCARTRKKEREEKEKKREKNPRQGKMDIMSDDKSSEDQEKCKEECDDVENKSSIFHAMCNPTSRTSLVP